MTKKEALKRAIAIAIDNGYVPAIPSSIFGDMKAVTWETTDIDITPASYGACVLWKKPGRLTESQSLWELFYSPHHRNFAKALWGENVYWTVILPDGKKEHTNGLPKWQYRLQQMVIADDPMQYLADHLPK